MNPLEYNSTATAACFTQAGINIKLRAVDSAKVAARTAFAFKTGYFQIQRRSEMGCRTMALTAARAVARMLGSRCRQ